jgi:hypothetical protein
MLIAVRFALSGTDLKGNSKSGPEKQKGVRSVLSYLKLIFFYFLISSSLQMRMIVKSKYFPNNQITVSQILI